MATLLSSAVTRAKRRASSGRNPPSPGPTSSEAQCVEQRQTTFTVLRQPRDQVLRGLELLRAAGEVVAAHRRALGMHRGDAGVHLGRQRQLVHFRQQRPVQLAAEAVGLGQGAAVEDRVAFAARRHQAGLGQHLQVVAHARLADGEDLRQLQHAERIVGQHPQHVQPQRVAAGLAQRGQLVAGIVADQGHAQAHRGRSLEPREDAGNGCIKKF
jgi:hypothetical protein